MADGPELIQLSHRKNPATRPNFSEVWDAYYQTVTIIQFSLLLHNSLVLFSYVVSFIHSNQNGLYTTLTKKVLSVNISEENMR